MALGFADSNALLVAIKTGLAPKDVAAGTARVGRTDDGMIVIEPDKSPPAGVLAKMRAAGVRDAAMPTKTVAVRCWAEALPPVAIGVESVPALALFVTQRVADVLDVAAELVRLGCDRIEISISGDHGVLRVVDPPTYTIVRALDRDRGLRVYGPDPAGQEAIWCELGYHHPVAESLRTERGVMLLASREGWHTIRDEGWMSLDKALELAVPERAEKIVPGAMPERRKIELRLSSGRRDVTSLWVLREDAVGKVDKLLEYLPDDVVGRLISCRAGSTASRSSASATAGRSQRSGASAPAINRASRRSSPSKPRMLASIQAGPGIRVMSNTWPAWTASCDRCRRIARPLPSRNGCAAFSSEMWCAAPSAKRSPVRPRRCLRRARSANTLSRVVSRKRAEAKRVPPLAMSTVRSSPAQSNTSPNRWRCSSW